MNHCINTTCAHCGHRYCLRCDSNNCPECGAAHVKKPWVKPELTTLPPEREETASVNDLYRYRFIAALLHLFAKEDGFRYHIARNGSCIEILMQSGDNVEHAIFDMAKPAREKAADLRVIIGKIVNFIS